MVVGAFDRIRQFYLSYYLSIQKSCKENGRGVQESEGCLVGETLTITQVTTISNRDTAVQVEFSEAAWPAIKVSSDWVMERMKKRDFIINAYRDHCIFMDRGGTLLEVFAELMGTVEWRASKSTTYYKHGDFVPGLKVDGIMVTPCMILEISIEHVMRVVVLDRSVIQLKEFGS
ncbi:uncharacterized protein LOC120171048 [Hibiscus syriacus]|uniref:uncharacterized protein LOC120171048 n=1 Tax=Hibiscus syriacus TaxID=106335 RepID=UPI001923F1AF|nr:uncharacterized protein LOC120171048 [Hibiscus syriacus]